MHSWTSIAIPFDAECAGDVRDRLRAIGNPAGKAVRDALRADLLIHFISAGVIDGEMGRDAHLLIEASSDVPSPQTIELIERRLGSLLEPAFDAAGLGRGNLARLMRSHRVETGQSLFGNAGLNFTGTPGMSVRRIRDEYSLSRVIRTLMDCKVYRGDPVDVRHEIIADLRERADFKPLEHLLEPAPAECLLGAPEQQSALSVAIKLLPAALATFFWPVLLAGLVALFAALWLALPASWEVIAMMVMAGALLTLFAATGVALVIYLKLLQLEASDVPDDSLPGDAKLNELARDENKTVQNHMTGVSVMKPGLTRRLTLKLAFWVIGHVAKLLYRPGFLGDLGTIHFARWLILPGTDRLVFLSNYGGSWESYLEDFITKAHQGLTAVWSNTRGFPRASNLFQDGATEGDRFKRWARRQQQPTPFWYSAYPHLTTSRIRANALLRQGLAMATTADEAELWLGQLGSRTPPRSLLEAEQVPTLMFGGLKHHPHAACILVKLPSDPGRARSWLSAARDQVGFGDQPDPALVAMLALSASGLRKLGLPDDVLASFPFAFRDGTASEARSKILEDTGDDKPEGWLWGNEGQQVDAVMVLYAADRRRLRSAESAHAQSLKASGGHVVHKIRLRPLPAEAQARAVGRRNQAREAFGFADGVSQPIIRGTRRSIRGRDELHNVEPGEFILGYPDNRGNVPYSPSVPAEADPADLLPTVAARPDVDQPPDFSVSRANMDRDFGRNGTYLVIRQLAQDAKAFRRSCAKLAQSCAGHPGIPAGFTPAQATEWISAKIIGRWRDGTSLVRFPNRPGTGWKGELDQVEPDNNFLLGAEDPIGHRCPFGAHIRRTNPRDSFTPGSLEQVSISNRHRLLRIGRGYPAYRRSAKEIESEGLLFMCFNADIERQFEFVQQTWSMAPQFHGLDNEVDGILGRGEKDGRLTIPTAFGPLCVRGLRDVVRVRGGGYFFVPSKAALEYLSHR